MDAFWRALCSSVATIELRPHTKPSARVPAGRRLQAPSGSSEPQPAAAIESAQVGGGQAPAEPRGSGSPRRRHQAWVPEGVQQAGGGAWQLRPCRFRKVSQRSGCEPGSVALGDPAGTGGFGLGSGTVWCFS